MKAYERRRQLNGAAVDLGYVLEQLDDFQRTVAHLAGAYPKSSGGGGDGGGPSTVLHCFEHQRDSCPCGNNMPVPGASDPTGDAAAGGDLVSRADAELDHRLTRAVDAVADLRRHISEWTTVTKLMPENEGRRGCEVVAKIRNQATKRPRFEEADFYTDVKGNLPRKMHLSRWAYEHVLKTGVLPDQQETLDHIDGKRIRCKHQRIARPKRKAS